MNPRRPFRAALRCSAVLCATLLLGVIILGYAAAAIRHDLRWRHSDYTFSLWQGRLGLDYSPPSSRIFGSFVMDLPWDPPTPRVCWGLSWGSYNGQVWVEIPLWIFLAPAAPGLIIAAKALTRRASPKGLCHQCKYDRTGLPPLSPCPECGRAPSA